MTEKRVCARCEPVGCELMPPRTTYGSRLIGFDAAAVNWPKIIIQTACAAITNMKLGRERCIRKLRWLFERGGKRGGRRLVVRNANQGGPVCPKPPQPHGVRRPSLDIIHISHQQVFRVRWKIPRPCGVRRQAKRDAALADAASWTGLSASIPPTTKRCRASLATALHDVEDAQSLQQFLNSS